SRCCRGSSWGGAQLQGVGHLGGGRSLEHGNVVTIEVHLDVLPMCAISQFLDIGLLSPHELDVGLGARWICHYNGESILEVRSFSIRATLVREFDDLALSRTEKEMDGAHTVDSRRSRFHLVHYRLISFVFHLQIADLFLVLWLETDYIGEEGDAIGESLVSLSLPFVHRTLGTIDSRWTGVVLVVLVLSSSSSSVLLLLLTLF
ncbi:hypothetical protein PMAYCL1PPCAC_02418, partial [Pristionchus mayeri]